MAGLRITGAQIRMARAFLGWSIADLAKAADVGNSTVQVVEAADDAAAVSSGGVETTRDHRAAARAEALGKIVAACTAAGVTFLPDDGRHGPGIRGRAKARR
jgi:hypothetical protein